MAKKKRKAKPTETEMPALEEGMLPDFITGKPVRETQKVGKRSVIKLRDHTQAAEDLDAEAQGHVAEYSIFLAVAEKASVDRRGNPLYKRSPDGTERVAERIEQESYMVNGMTLIRPRKVRSLEIDDDFLTIIDAYWKFRRKNREPGLA